MLPDTRVDKSTDPGALIRKGQGDTSLLSRFGTGFFCCYIVLVWWPWCLGLVGGVPFGWWFAVGNWSINTRSAAA
jgi:hypothetical protein